MAWNGDCREQKIERSLAKRIKLAGYKLTPARLAVLQVIEQEAGHLSPAQIVVQAQALYPALGRATVYRTLELLTELGIVRPIYLGDESASFIRAEGGHHHLICSQCGTVIEFDECVVGELALELAERFAFTIRSHLLEFYGLCQRCGPS